jgi:hypothetical protein
MSETIDRARKLLNSRLVELNGEAGALRRALEGMGETPPPAAPARARSRPRRRNKRSTATTSPRTANSSQPATKGANATKRSKSPNAAKPAKSPKATNRGKKRTARAPRGQRAEQLLAAVKANPGATASELARQIGVSANQGHALAGRLHKQGALTKRKKGYRLAKKPAASK